jgi:hypothetical protein
MARFATHTPFGCSTFPGKTMARQALPFEIRAKDASKGVFIRNRLLGGKTRGKNESSVVRAFEETGLHQRRTL